jgi:hypothetical protein
MHTVVGQVGLVSISGSLEPKEFRHQGAVVKHVVTESVEGGGAHIRDVVHLFILENKRVIATLKKS